MDRSLFTLYLVFIGVSFSGSTNGYVVTARGKPASSSSIRNTANDPGNAVDGFIYTVLPNIFHSAAETSSGWWRVNLQEEVVSPRIAIYFRTDNKSRRNGVRISLSPTEGGTSDFCEYVTGHRYGYDIPAVYQFTCDARGRYLTISTVTNNDGNGAVLDFGEVEVYACSLYTFGPNCSSECHCAGEPCDWTLESPACPSGCLPGWTSRACDTFSMVSVYTKYLHQCHVSIFFIFESVDIRTLVTVQVVEVNLRTECMLVCEAVVPCAGFEYSETTCTLWGGGATGRPGSRDMWRKLD